MSKRPRKDYNLEIGATAPRDEVKRILGTYEEREERIEKNSRRKKMAKQKTGTGSSPSGTPNPNVQKIEAYFECAVNRANQGGISLEMSALGAMYRGLNDNGMPVDNKGKVITDPKQLKDISLGRELYQGFDGVAEKVFSGESLSPELAALRSRGVREAIGLSNQQRTGLEAHFRTGKPVSPSKVLLEQALPVKRHFIQYFQSLYQDMFIDAAAAEDSEAKALVLAIAQKAGLQITEEHLNTPQGFEHYTVIVAKALEQRAGYQ